MTNVEKCLPVTQKDCNSGAKGLQWQCKMATVAAQKGYSGGAKGLQWQCKRAIMAVQVLCGK